MSRHVDHIDQTVPEVAGEAHAVSGEGGATTILKTRSSATPFEAKAAAHWTEEREAKLIAGKNLFLKPSGAATLLRSIGLLNADASMSSDSVKKFLQINHMLTLIAPHLNDLAERHPTVRVFDACCGTSYLSFAVAWYFEKVLRKPALILGVDRNAGVIETSKKRAGDLGYGAFMHFAVGDVDTATWDAKSPEAFGEGAKAKDGTVARPHLVLALHACDTATDAALAAAIKVKADFIAVAPCCHAELAQKWKTIAASPHPLAPIFRTPNLRRETAAQMTDAMRLVLLRARGYEVTATEFVPSAHTPKNRLLLAERRANFLAAAEAEFAAMKEALGGQSIALEDMLGART